MMAHHRVIATGVLLSFVGHVSPTAARGSQVAADPPWNSEHIAQLPEEIRKALIRLCGESAQAAHYFATYSQNSKLINLHFEHFQCQTNNVLCTQAGCLHQVYILRGGHYRLLRSYYGPRDD
jgi:hypothetical protein